MGLRAFVTVRDVTEDEYIAGNERWLREPESSTLMPFQYEVEVREAWVSLEHNFFWGKYPRGDWPWIAWRLQVIGTLWPGREVVYHNGDQDPADVEALNLDLLNDIWTWWFGWETHAEDWEGASRPCRHDELVVEVSRQELHPVFGQGAEQFLMQIQCPCHLRLFQPFRSKDDPDRVEAALTEPDVRSLLLALAGQRQRGLLECIDVARATLI